MRRLWLGGALVLGWAVATPAHAYVQTKASETGVLLKWPKPCIRLNLMLLSKPLDMTEVFFRTAANESAAVWSSSRISGTKMFVTVSGTPSSGRYVEHDKVNAVQFRTDFWGRNARAIKDRLSYPTNALAITSVFANRVTGEIVDTDVEINNTGPKWGDVVASPELLRASNTHDLQNTLTHEFGHVVGLDHTCDGGGQSNDVDHLGQPVPPCPGPISVQETTMAAIVEPGDTLRRTLAADDQLAMREIYPADGKPACSNEGTGGCTMGPHRTRNGVGLWATLAVALIWAGKCARRRRQLPPRRYL